MAFLPLKSFFPTADELLQQDLPTLGGVLLTHLKSYQGLNTVYQHAGLNRRYFRAMLENQNVGLGPLPKEPEYGTRQAEVTKRMMEAWNWLETEGLLIQNDQQVADWFIISTDGEKYLPPEKRPVGPSPSPAQAPKSARSRICVGGFGKYILANSIGDGGAGTVYNSWTEENEPCAVKVLNSAEGSKLKRFKNEIAFCFRTQHKNIISVLDFGQTFDGKHFYVMPLYGSTLRKLISAGIETGRVIDLFSQILEGVEAAHINKVWHRDLKPENILWDETEATLVVADFGIAKFKEENLQTSIETTTHERLANFVYSAPEQRIKGKAVDQRSDIYALGLILNEMFTGDVPQGTGLKRIAAVAPEYSYVDAVVDSMVQQVPENRPGSMQRIRDLLGINSPARANTDAPEAKAQPTNLSGEDWNRSFEEADVDFEITQGMQQNFIVRFDNKSHSQVTIRKFNLSYKGLKIVEAPPPDKGRGKWKPIEAKTYGGRQTPTPSDG